MNRSQNGFSAIAVIFFVVAMLAVSMAFISVKKTSHTAQKRSTTLSSKSDISNERLIYVGFGNAQACQNPPGITVELNYVFSKHYALSKEINFANMHKPSAASLEVNGKTYPITLDNSSSAVGSAQIHWVFNDVPLDQATTKDIVGLQGTIHYTINERSVTTPSFTFDSGSCEA